MTTGSDNQNLVEQLEHLESKVAFQDDTIEQLNQSIIELNKELNAVRNDLVILAQKLSDSQQATNDSTQVEIPPHY